MNKTIGKYIPTYLSRMYIVMGPITILYLLTLIFCK